MSENGVKSKIQEATANAVDFLLQRQEAAGCWSDFLLPAGKSNIWVTGFVGSVLAKVPDSRAQSTVRSAWRFLEENAKRERGWSYNAKVPGDADSTLWGLRFAQ